MKELSRAGWLAERRTYVGASDMAQVVGLSPWGDPVSLWERKTGRTEEGGNETFRMRLGTLIEPIIGQLASEALGAKLHRVSGPVRMKEFPFIASNPDFRIVGQRGLVQAKHSTNRDHWGESEIEVGVGLGIPLHYRVQGWGELLTTGLDFVIFAVLDPFSGLSLHRLDRRASDNEQAIEDLKNDVVDFWTNYVVPDVMPPPTSKSTEALSRIYRHRVETKIGKVASAAQEQTLEALAAAQDALKAQEAVVEGLKNEVKAMIGEAHYIEGAGFRYSWGETTRKTVAWKEVAGIYRKIVDIIGSASPTTLAYALEQAAAQSLDDIEGLYTQESTSRGPFTAAKL